MNCKSILKKKIPLNFIATSTQKQLHEIKLRKKKMKQIFANAVKKSQKKKGNTTKHTLSFDCEKKRLAKSGPDREQDTYNEPLEINC